MSVALLNIGLNDRKLVAADARHRVGFANASAQPVGNGLQQLVADLMPERVIDTLETVQIDAEHGEALAPSHAGKRARQLLAKMHTIGQVGKRIVARHMRDLLFR